MQSREIRDFDQWRAAARALLAAGIEPGRFTWTDWRTPGLSSGPHFDTSRGRAAELKIPRRLYSLLETLACYRDDSRWELMYRLMWRILKEDQKLLDDLADRDVHIAHRWQRSVDQDVHKMHAFVRFHETVTEDGVLHYVAWFEPAHEILRAVIPFFERRFPNMHWMIATPDGAAVWNGTRTEIVESPDRGTLARADSTHSLWRSYYRSICNVTRINTDAMQRHMPRRYWHNLPEASEIASLTSNGRAVAQQALETEPSAEDLRIPKGVDRAIRNLGAATDSAMSCRRCDLWRQATQAVLGEGPENAPMMLVGEQPGDDEDISGRPFVGPAGRLLDRALAECGIDRSRLFITNAVKHFKWEPRGKRRLHKRPDSGEVQACGVWLTREIEQVSPRVIVTLGATALRAVTGLNMKIEDARAEMFQHPEGAAIVPTYHPSAILRSEGERQNLLLSALKEDLSRAFAMVAPASATPRFAE